MQLVLFMLVVSLIAGLVAAGGDWMGHRAARRKIRFGKMRPRHVSRLFAVITGVLIALVTFGVVFAVWKDVREAFTRYAIVKKDLKQTEANLMGMESSLAKAKHEVAAADEKVAAAGIVVEDLSLQVYKGREQTIELAIDLSKLNEEIVAKEKERDELLKLIKEKEGEKAREEKRVEGLVGLKNQLGREIEALEAKVASYQEGEIAIRRGTNLAYERVGINETGSLRDKLQSAVNRVVVKLAQQGLKVDPETERRAEEFIQVFSHTGDAVIIISTAQNVVEGQSVVLAFESRPLAPIVSQGGVLLEVKVKQSTASIAAFGQPPSQTSVKIKLDSAGVDQLITAIEAELQATAKDLGFLPGLRTGKISTNTSALSSMVEKLAAQSRPFIIRFIADEPITILDGLESVHIVVEDAA